MPIDTDVCPGGFKVTAETRSSVLFKCNRWTTKFVFYSNIVDLQYCLSLGYITKLFSYTHTHTYIVFFIFFSIMAYGKILNIVPSAIQQVLFAYFIYIYAHIYTPHLYPFICQWTFRLFPCLGCCKDLLS